MSLGTVEWRLTCGCCRPGRRTGGACHARSGVGRSRVRCGRARRPWPWESPRVPQWSGTLLCCRRMMPRSTLSAAHPGGAGRQPEIRTCAYHLAKPLLQEELASRIFLCCPRASEAMSTHRQSTDAVLQSAFQMATTHSMQHCSFSGLLMQRQHSKE